MFALGRAERAVLLATGTLALAGAFVTAPFIARGSAAHDDHALDVLASGASPAAVVFGPLRPRRDPFAGDEEPSASSPSPAPASSLPAIPAVPAALPILPPNAAAPNATVRVAAIVTGAHPFALITDERGPHLLARGDRIAGSVVATIDGTGVMLVDGSRLPLRSGFEGGSPP
ncbi:MAG: hypothetical protein ABR975_09160 [Vulcanimicrobiaceae bacterium]|jgi:hypothetical protein